MWRVWPTIMRVRPLWRRGWERFAGVKLLGHFTNMVFVDVPADRLRELDVHLREAGVRISIGYLPTLRLVTHLDIDDEGIARTVDAFRRFFVRS